MKRAMNRGGADCARSWEVEAGRDGRLSVAAIEKLALHVEECAACRAQSDYLVGLGRDLRGLVERGVDDLALQRLRARVLAGADAELAGRSRPSRPARHVRARILLPALALVAVTLVLAGWKWARPTPEAALPRTTVDAVDEGGARWTRQSEGEIEHVDLNDGTLRLRVRKAPGGRRVVVRVPDGEIEDLGTVFHVVVAHGHTQRVGVDEGRVTIRLKNAAPITISSGQIWERPEDPPENPPISASAPDATAPAVAPVEKHVAAPSPNGGASARVPPPHAEEEDATYMRALRLLREGHGDQAKDAAREYLRNFPNGFRREEMGRIGN